MLGSRRRAEKDVERLLRDGVDPPGDARLLERFRVDRDESAFGAIVERHGPLVLALCRRYLREPADVDDAFQATFLVLARKGGGLRDGDALSSWLYGVARRVATRARSDVLRRRAREAGADHLDEAASAPERPADDALEALDRELSRLPEKYRAPLVLCHLDGRTYDQAAAELGWPPGTVRSRTARAREILRDRLSRRGFDAPACLAAIRLDVASAPLAPASLVAETAAAASRFVGLASFSRILDLTSWPAAALAQGVISTMSPSPWKLLGIGLASVGLSAGAFAVASGGLAPAGQEKPPGPPPAVAEEKPGPERVERRLDDLEAKIDRIAAMLANRAATAPSPPPPSRPSPDAGPDRDGEGRSIPDPRGLREIEAQLINAHLDYKNTLALHQRAVVSKNEVDASAKPARILLARLLEMQDEIQDRRSMFEDGERIVEQRRREVDSLESLLEKARQEDEQRSGPRSAARIADLQGAIRRAEEAVEAAIQDVERLNREFARSSDRSKKIAQLIAWTREHFPEVQLTLDDAAGAK
ncbi:MAG: hypothetical protein BGO49_30865 [Planctomycetales bacterium 71-10]|nr:MAG: hypothetical protein BGO49_30865 [Planctomycetales bacterium 71-10]